MVGRRRQGQGEWRQLTFDERPTRSGKPRRRSGRKRTTRKGYVPHRTRPRHVWWKPLHITMRAVAGLPSFRQQVLYAALLRAFRTTRREDFRIVEYSVQSNHLHLLVEAEDKEALARGMASFAVRANRLLNGAIGRGRGRVWGERYHRHDLRKPIEVRNALVYCMSNFRKHVHRMERAEAAGPHGLDDAGHLLPSEAIAIDPCSSGPWFEGWLNHYPPPEIPRPTPRPRTFLLRDGWQRHGFLHPFERPKANARA